MWTSVYVFPDPFAGFTDQTQELLTQSYVSGVSLTAANGFAEHLWTFAAGGQEISEGGDQQATDPMKVLTY